MAIGHTGTLFICDNNNKRVCIVSSQGQHMEDINLGNLSPQDVVVTSPGELMITCSIDIK